MSAQAEMRVIAEALDSIEDGMAIVEGPAFVHRRVRDLGGSEQAADLARAIARLLARTSPYANPSGLGRRVSPEELAEALSSARGRGA